MRNTETCPIPGCPQPHIAALAEVLNPPRMTLTLADLSESAVTDAIDADVTARGERVRAIIAGHAASHSPEEYIAVIHDLRCRLAAYECGIRPHHNGLSG